MPSSHLNPIENLWNILVRRVYEGCHHSGEVGALKDAIGEVWDLISKEELGKLVFLCTVAWEL